MKKILITSLLAALSVFVATPAFAGKGGKGGKKGEGREGKKGARGEFQEVLSKYDKNSNGSIDGDERTALKTDFATDASLKKLDLNANGTLDDAEIDAVKGHTRGEGKKKGERKRNKV